MYSRKYIIILIYIILILLLFIIRPSMMFDYNGNIKKFGYNNENENMTSLLSIEIIIPLLVIISYIIYLSIQLII
tara:strand:- start:5165 stop:5389 length:225 start_codon:yes stop_codon:yes gene_type:complete